MLYKHFKSGVKVPVAVNNKVRAYVKVSIHLLSRYTLMDVYELCYRYNIKVLSCVSLGGILSKKYLIHIEGYRSDIVKLNTLIND